MTFDLTVTKTLRGAEGSHQSAPNDYLMIGGVGVRYFLRGGQVWNESGVVVEDDDIPDFVSEQIKTLTSEMRLALGFDRIEERIIRKAEKPVLVPPHKK